MTVRRVMIAVALACGLCVWGFARSGESSLAAQPAELGAHEAAEENEDARDDAAAHFRASRSRHWRYVAVGNTYTP